jgi:hypothetical protein
LSTRAPYAWNAKLIGNRNICDFAMRETQSKMRGPNNFNRLHPTSVTLL